jgi:hypothetical protein
MSDRSDLIDTMLKAREAMLNQKPEPEAEVLYYPPALVGNGLDRIGRESYR